MKKLILAVLLFAQMPVIAETIACDFAAPAGDVIKDKAKRLKAYTGQYWMAAESEIQQLSPALRKKGFVVGDFHFNNVGVYFDYSRNHAELIVNDFDDAGYNYLIVDLLKYLSFLKRLDKSFDLTEFISDYQAGLTDRVSPMPEELTSLMNRSQYEFTKDYQKYYESKRQEAEIFNDKNLSDLQKQNMQHFAGLKLIKQLSDVKSSFQINDSGSSLEMERYVFVGSDSKGASGVIEFKQLKCSATAEHDRQDLKANYDKVKAYYQNQFPAAYLSAQTVYFYDSNFYMVREKKNNPLKKLDIAKMQPEKLKEYAKYYANYLGHLHRPQAGSDYASAVDLNKQAISGAVKKINEKFKDILK